MRHDLVSPGKAMTSNQGLKVSDDQNSERAGVRGASPLEDFLLREKITHFDQERIPERVVHARGAGAHGVFECYEDLSDLTMASPFTAAGKTTPVFTRFSTVAGSRGSADPPRDVRGFASLSPEISHMLMWTMSDRACPRSFGAMEGFGVHTWRLVNAKGKSRFVKFHWKPVKGVHSLVWDEAQKISGKDPAFNRRAMFEPIEKGDFLEWELGLQVIEEEDEFAFDFDLLDDTRAAAARPGLRFQL